MNRLTIILDKIKHNSKIIINKTKIKLQFVWDVILRRFSDIDEGEPNIKSTAVFGYVSIIVFLFIFIIWSLLSHLETAAVAPGKIIIETNRKTIQHLEGGIIKRILIHEGSIVKKGDLLFELEDTQAKAKYDALSNEVNALYAREARLTTLLSGAKSIVFPDILLSQKEKPKVRQILESQVSLFNSENKAFLGQLEILDQRVSQLKNQIESYKAQVKSNEEQLKYLRLELDAVTILEKKHIIEKTKLWALEREIARLQGNRDELVASIAQAEQKIGETRQQSLTLKDTREKENFEKLTEVQAKLVTIIEQEKAAEDILKRLKIKAPLEGTVVGLKEHTIGGVISAGDPLLDIVPFGDELVVEANISPMDIESVHPGLIAKIQLSAYKRRSTPWVGGKVTNVSADVFVEQQTGKSYYTARIKISQNELKKLKNIILYPGMPVEVMIVIDKRTPLQYFISPLLDSFNRAFREE